MRRATLIFGLVLATAAYAGGDSGYKPGAPPPPQTFSFSYFCRSDALDGRYFMTKPRFAYQGKPNGTMAGEMSSAWAAYLKKTYGIGYRNTTTCDLMVTDQIDAAFQNIATSEEKLHRKMVYADWQYAP